MVRSGLIRSNATATVGRDGGSHGGSAGRPAHGSARGATWRPAMVPAGTAVTVREVVLPAHVRVALAVAEASLVRDVAAFGALVVFGTAVAVVCGFGPWG